MKKKIKAWAVIGDFGLDKFPKTFSIKYLAKSFSDDMRPLKTKVIPCTISYSIPSKSKKK